MQKPLLIKCLHYINRHGFRCFKMEPVPKAPPEPLPSGLYISDKFKKEDVEMFLYIARVIEKLVFLEPLPIESSQPIQQQPGLFLDPPRPPARPNVIDSFAYQRPIRDQNNLLIYDKASTILRTPTRKHPNFRFYDYQISYFQNLTDEEITRHKSNIQEGQPYPIKVYRTIAVEMLL